MKAQQIVSEAEEWRTSFLCVAAPIRHTAYGFEI